MPCRDARRITILGSTVAADDTRAFGIGATLLTPPGFPCDAVKGIFEDRLEPLLTGLSKDWEGYREEADFSAYIEHRQGMDPQSVEMIRETVELAGRVHAWVEEYGEQAAREPLAIA